MTPIFTPVLYAFDTNAHGELEILAEQNKGITRRQFGKGTAVAGLLSVETKAQSAKAAARLPGIWQRTLGTPEKLTPVQVRRYRPDAAGLAKLPPVTSPPVSVSGHATSRGYEVHIPLEPGEMVYGLGLQFQSLLQRGLKKKLRVNADPVADTGDSHAPVPFYVSNRGYGIFIDTARYLNIYCGNKIKKDSPHPIRTGDAKTAAQVAQLPKSFERYRMNEASEVLIEVPQARGVDLYILGGPTMKNAVQRYNLFAGGGPLLPRCGLGFWYRAYGGANQDEIVALAEELRTRNIPCDVLGLEPGWQSHSYSCSFVWSQKFPDPDAMISKLNARNLHVNLWEHAFTHPSSPIYSALKPHSGDYEVWEGIVPDFLDKTARDIFGNYHDEYLVAHGISGFKLDECDNSDYTRNWSFPEVSSFPSGADGEQMHCFFGLHYQDTIQSVYERRNLRTLGLVRSSHALATPYPYTLYSDLYDHKEFIRAVANAGFCGLLWCPEVRDAKSTEDLIRRLQTAIFSPLAMVNAWYIKNPPWKQVNQEANNEGRFAENWEQVEAQCRKLIEVRMQLLPYLYAAYVRYHQAGSPVFRALVMDYPDDAQTWTIDNQYLVGDSMLVAPVVAGEHEREVYLPTGDWFDFWTGKHFAGNQRTTVPVPLEQIPVFVKGGSLLPLAKPAPHTVHADSYQLTVRRYGGGNLQCVLYEDDGSPQTDWTTVNLAWDEGQPQGTVQRAGPKQSHEYVVSTWERVTG
jgi:alpha-D-xyloside xylohydrolase